MSLKKQYIFTQKLQSLYKSGSSLMNALDKMALIETNQRTKSIILFLKDEIKGGRSLSDAMMSSECELFDETYCRLIRAGEISGKLESVLLHILQFQRQLLEFKNKLIAALVYPVIIILVFSLVFSVIFFFVIPLMAKTMLDAGASIPPVLALFSGIAQAITFPKAVFSVGIIATILYLLSYVISHLDIIAYPRDLILLSIPIVGGITKTNNLYNLVFIMSICNSSGVSVSEYLDLAKNSLTNRYLQAQMEDIPPGDSLYLYLQQTKIVPPDLLEYIAIGEQSGTLEDAFNNLLERLDKKRTHYLFLIIGLTKPMGILMGISVIGIIFFIVISIIMNAFNQIQNALPPSISL